MKTDHKIAIKVRDLTAGYNHREVLHDISFDVRHGEVFIIIGPSGCGKSTLLKHLIGLFAPIRGEVWIEGENIVTAEGEARLELLQRFGVVYQSCALFGSMTVSQNIKLPLDQFTDLPEAGKEHLAMARLKAVGLEGAAERMPSELSGGMRKRAAIARALALDPRLLFLDEPSAGLDPTASAELDVLIQQLSHYFGITFVIVSHDLPSINTIGDRLIMLGQGGRIIAEGSRADFVNNTNPDVRRFFHRQPASGNGTNSYGNKNE